MVKKTSSWEDGIVLVTNWLIRIFAKFGEIIKKIIKIIFSIFYEEITGKSLPLPPEKQENLFLVLADNEPNDFVHIFDQHPYDTPVLESPIQVNNGIIWINIKAAGLIPKYSNASKEDLKRLVVLLIQKWYQKNRQRVGISVYIKVLTSKRLYIAIPLSIEAQNFLEKEEQNNRQTVDQFTEKALEEAVPDSNERIIF